MGTYTPSSCTVNLRQCRDLANFENHRIGWRTGMHSQNASYVPPPNEMTTCLEWESSCTRVATAHQIALAHAQFEAIHRSDGNGRVGRLLPCS